MPQGATAILWDQTKYVGSEVTQLEQLKSLQVLLSKSEPVQSAPP